MTYTPKSDFLATITARGFLADCTDLEGLDAHFLKGGVTGYIGFDLTATSLHIGNLVQIMLLRWMQKTGHRPITLMGGGTTKVGDPSGKDEMRKILTVDQINANADGIRQVFSRYISYGDGPTDSPLVFTRTWSRRRVDRGVLQADGVHRSTLTLRVQSVDDSGDRTVSWRRAAPMVTSAKLSLS